MAIECKWSAEGFDPVNFLSFTPLYPRADLVVVAADVERPFTHQAGGLKIHFVGLEDLVRRLEAH